MKALILAGGRGNRINEFSENQNKCMIPFMDKPLLEHNLNRIAAQDVSEIVIVVGYKAEDIINHYGIRFRGKPIRYVIQREQKGLVHAIECARKTLDGEDFFLMLGDEILIGSKEGDMIQYFRETQAVFAVCGILKAEIPDQIRRTYTLVKDQEDTVFRLIEKPRRPINEYQGTGHCIFRNAILDYVEITPIHHERGEKELPDLIQCCIDDGKLVKAFIVCERYANVNSTEDLSAAEKLVRHS
jgi:UDP-N-acetylglucosamine diphosphorylase / glucose-1-phosphate thymidylyltransferase / UDP-N-acetylgalactosamine diphosphorylase / glucosamine-1-phosphate N-acetyltransferase / galactosamine-1-phosphate N-acetyltransferase